MINTSHTKESKYYARFTEVEKLRETSRYPTGCSAPLSCSGPGTVLMLACQALVNPLLAHSKRLGISGFAPKIGS
jgi:hypothetical protein